RGGRDGHGRGDRDVDLAGDDDEGQAEGQQAHEDVRRREVEQVRAVQEEARERPAPDPGPDDQHDEQRLPACDCLDQKPRRSAHASTVPSCAASSSARRRRRSISCRRCVIRASIVTATTIAVPSKKIFQNSEIFRSVKPSLIVATRIAPSTAPRTVPEPPNTLTPPMTTAVTTSNSKPLPATASTLAKRA